MKGPPFLVGATRMLRAVVSFDLRRFSEEVRTDRVLEPLWDAAQGEHAQSMKNTVLYLFALALLAVSSSECSRLTRRYLNLHVDEINAAVHEGMTREEVVQALGEPAIESAPDINSSDLKFIYYNSREREDNYAYPLSIVIYFEDGIADTILVQASK